MMLPMLIVATLAVVQSVFGVGVLLFGTPLLLALGMTFTETLWILLPASLTINTLQLALDRGVDFRQAKAFMLFTLPCIVAGLLVKEYLHLRVEMPIALLLFLCAGVRVSSRFSACLERLLTRFSTVSLMLMGALHGLTNMGGSLLSVYAAGRFRGKLDIRQYIALGYALFAATQLVTLSATGTSAPAVSVAMFAAIGGGVYLLVGRRVFSAVNHTAFSVALSVFMVLCGVMLLWKVWA
ncbi:MAG: TSUP family transporter [Bilophila sp.]